MINVNFINNYNKDYDIYRDIYQECAAIAMKILKKDDEYDLSVTLVDNEFIHQMNKHYRNKDYVTDVISFENDFDVNIDIEYYDLGDIFISVDKAIAQANEYHHSLKRELIFLFIHGLLHCCGYDHLNENDEKIMFSIQGGIMDEIKNKISF
ncbi:MAG: rRNA maturation RNase YbeY [Bacilli bacterium]|jgi:probable rRNA maturation factor|nr:rRNA maturation RNase YbeY [Bacilli bacterium]